MMPHTNVSTTPNAESLEVVLSTLASSAVDPVNEEHFRMPNWHFANHQVTT